jgi:hypothetical protein
VKKARIININYVECSRRLTWANIQQEKPWIVLGPETASFATHAEAITYADRLVREPK